MQTAVYCFGCEGKGWRWGASKRGGGGGGKKLNKFWINVGS